MRQNMQVCVKGLPFECSDGELRAFFDNKGVDTVEIERNNGKATGEGIVTFIDEDYVEDALKKDREMLKHRYIEVFRSGDKDRSSDRRRFDRGTRRDDSRSDRGESWGGRPQPFDRYPPQASPQKDFPYGFPKKPGAKTPGGEKYGTTEYDGKIVRLRGVPFSVTVADVIDFFSPLDIVRDGVLLTDQRVSVTSGDAFVVFADLESCERAKDRHMQHMGHRYIEVFEATYSELVKFCSKHGTRIPPMSQSFPVAAQPPINRYDSPPYSGTYNGPVDPYSRGHPSQPSQMPYNGPADPYNRSFAPQQLVEEYRYEARAPAGFYDTYVPPAVYDSYPGSNSRQDPRDDPRYSRPDPRTQPAYPTRDDPRDFPRDDRRDFLRDDPRDFPRDDPRLSDYGYAPRDNYDSNWRTGISGGGPSRGPPPSEWDDRREIYSSYPGDRYDQREAGGAMRRQEYRRDDRYAPRPDPYARRERYISEDRGHFVLKMRGIPFRASEAEVIDWFSPARPNRVELLRDGIGRPNGDARVIFHDRKDYDQALLKDKQYMGERYIEMIPDNGRY